MVYKERTKLNEELINEIRTVERICVEYDKLKGNLFLDTSLNFNPEIKCIFLAYEDNQLVSLISLFIPTKEEAEISAYTLPQYRKKGYFKSLLTLAIDEMKQHNIKELLFVCEPYSKDGIEAIRSLNTPLDFTEYSLRLTDFSTIAKVQQISGLKFCIAELSELEIMVKLSQDIFEDTYEDAKSMITRSFETDTRVQYLGKLEDEIVGMGTASFENDEVCINGFGISKQYQGKGLGRDMLHLMLNELYKRGFQNITIEVNSNNEVAFNLYKKCGFEVISAINYYRKSVI